MTSSRRTVVLMAVLLVLVLGYVTRSFWDTSYHVAARKAEPPLAGQNAISALAVSQEPNGRWFATFDYFYTGAPEGAVLNLRVPKAPTVPGMRESTPSMERIAWARPERGQHRLRLEVQRPHFTSEAFVTERVQVEMNDPKGTVASAEVAQRIQWPDGMTAIAERELADKTPAELLARAVALVDEGDPQSLGNARRLLERLLRQNPQLDAAYVELARIAMKSNWGPEGLHQGEAFLQSALGIRPDSVDAKNLLGYVYAHQRRYKEAEALFAQCEAAGTKNLWLWANWGELLAMQGKPEQAIAKYQHVLAVPPTRDSNDRARVDAYKKTMRLLEARRDVHGIDQLYRQRIADYGQANCVGADYSMFVLRKRGETDRAVELARQAIDGQCGPRATLALGMAQYVAWANAPEASRAPLLNEARVSLPLTSGVLYELAADERTAGTVKKLVQAGEPIDQRDNGKVNALAHALQRGDHAAARRLLALGAKPGALVGFGEVPVAFVPLVSGDVDGVRLMRQFGVDYARLAYQGRTGVDVARELGDRRMLDALGVSDQRNRL